MGLFIPVTHVLICNKYCEFVYIWCLLEDFMASKITLDEGCIKIRD
jgi:hypothetical protein